MRILYLRLRVVYKESENDHKQKSCRFDGKLEFYLEIEMEMEI